jgi:NAD(P)-dependent dehydrogenase (short-subunit alcohol dehydrogenase family)
MSHVAIVTGGTRGIGRAICEALKADGFTVVANYAGNEEKARAFTDETGIAGPASPPTSGTSATTRRASKAAPRSRTKLALSTCW